MTLFKLFLPELVADDGGCLSIVTDGVSNHSRPLGVVVSPLGGEFKPAEHVFALGGNPTATVKFTGLSQEAFDKMAIHPDAAVEKISELFARYKWLVCANRPFVVKFLTRFAELPPAGTRPYPMPDMLVDVAALAQSADDVPASMDDGMPKLDIEARLRAVEGLMRSGTKPVSFAALCRQLDIFVPTVPSGMEWLDVNKRLAKVARHYL